MRAHDNQMTTITPESLNRLFPAKETRCPNCISNISFFFLSCARQKSTVTTTNKLGTPLASLSSADVCPPPKKTKSVWTTTKLYTPRPVIPFLSRTRPKTTVTTTNKLGAPTASLSLAGGCISAYQKKGVWTTTKLNTPRPVSPFLLSCTRQKRQ